MQEQQDSFTLRDVFSRNKFSSLLGALAMLSVAYVVEHFANIYAFAYSQRPTSNYVGDLILENIPPGLGLFDAIYTYLNFQTGLFFSGHTGMPFLVALIFLNNKMVRYVLLSLSFIFAVAVLLAHIHYSIDVLAAPFMAYCIFKIAQYLFPRDYDLTDQLGTPTTNL